MKTIDGQRAEVLDSGFEERFELTHDEPPVPGFELAEWMNRYGDWTNDDTGRFGIPKHLSGSDYSGTLAEVSNARVWAKEFADAKNVWWTHATGHHGTYAIVVDTEKLPDEAIEVLHGLQHYPVIDDTDFAQLEVEKHNEAWDDHDRDEFRRLLETRFESELQDRPTLDAALRELFDDVAGSIGEYYSNEQGDTVYINVKRIADKVDAEAFDALSRAPGES